MAWHVRAARADELAALPAIEVAAGAVFAAYGLPEVAAEPPTPVSQLRADEKYGRAWVVVGADDAPVGYLLADVLDGEGHVTQVSVHPRWARRGLGGLLVEEAARWAASKGMTAPSPPCRGTGRTYERLGFRRLEGSELTPGLRAALEREGALEAGRRSTETRAAPTLPNPLSIVLMARTGSQMCGPWRVHG